VPLVDNELALIRYVVSTLKAFLPQPRVAEERGAPWVTSINFDEEPEHRYAPLVAFVDRGLIGVLISHFK
jgi:hypothetical protein